MKSLCGRGVMEQVSRICCCGNGRLVCHGPLGGIRRIPEVFADLFEKQVRCEVPWVLIMEIVAL